MHLANRDMAAIRDHNGRANGWHRFGHRTTMLQWATGCAANLHLVHVIINAAHRENIPQCLRVGNGAREAHLEANRVRNGILVDCPCKVQYRASQFHHKSQVPLQWRQCEVGRHHERRGRHIRLVMPIAQPPGEAGVLGNWGHEGLCWPEEDQCRSLLPMGLQVGLPDPMSELRHGSFN